MFNHFFLGNNDFIKKTLLVSIDIGLYNVEINGTSIGIHYVSFSKINASKTLNMNELLINYEIPIWIILLSILWVTNFLGVLKVTFNIFSGKNKRNSQEKGVLSNKIRFQLESALGFSIFMGVLALAYDIQASQLKTDYVFNIDSLTNTYSFIISFALTFIGIIILSCIDFKLNLIPKDKNENYA